MGRLGGLARQRRLLWALFAIGFGGVAAAGRSDGAGSAATLRVRQTLEVEGRIFAPTGRGSEPVRRPIALTGRFDYVQKPAAAPPEGAVVRRYLDAVADLRIDGAKTRTVLGPDARVVHVAVRGTAPVAYLPDAALTREEADLLDTPFDALLLDAIRPPGRVAAGTTWKVAADVAAGLLAIDTVEGGELTGTIVDLADGRGTLHVSGTISGAVDGVPTRLVVEAEGMVPVEPAAEAAAADSHTGAADASAAVTVAGWVCVGPHDQWVVTIREQRQASHVAPGFEVEARIAVSRRAADTSPDRTPSDRPPEQAEAVAEAGSAPVGKRPPGGGPGRIWYRDPAGRYDLVHDARWRLVEEGPTGAVFRFVDRGTLVGQCSITSLPRIDVAAAATVADVQRDVESSLGGQFGRFAEAGEAGRDDGVRDVRVVSQGRAGSLPFRWIHHVLTDSRGQRASAAFMVEESLAERFAAADRDLIAGLLFGPPPAATAAGPGGADRPAEREARLPRETASP